MTNLRAVNIERASDDWDGTERRTAGNYRGRIAVQLPGEHRFTKPGMVLRVLVSQHCGPASQQHRAVELASSSQGSADAETIAEEAAQGHVSASVESTAGLRQR
jgi:hypothetical protein